MCPIESERTLISHKTTAMKDESRLHQVDGFRGIAALAVMAYHIQNLFGLTLGFERAYLFVDMFFMLSGFVLARAWTPIFGRDFATIDLLKARVRRLWPTIAAGALFGAAVHAFLQDTPNIPLFLLLALLLVPAFWQSESLFPLNGPLWSIFWELFANVAHMLWLRRLSERGLVALCFVMGLCLIVVTTTRGSGASGPDGHLWFLGLVRVGWSYSIGMLLAHLHRRSNWKSILRWWQALALPVLAVLIVPLIALPTAVGDELLVVGAFPLMFWLIITAHPPAKARKSLTSLGALSYPLYAIHLPLLSLFASFHQFQATSAAMATLLSLLIANSSGRLRLGLGKGRDREPKVLLPNRRASLT